MLKIVFLSRAVWSSYSQILWCDKQRHLISWDALKSQCLSVIHSNVLSWICYLHVFLSSIELLYLSNEIPRPLSISNTIVNSYSFSLFISFLFTFHFIFDQKPAFSMIQLNQFHYRNWKQTKQKVFAVEKGTQAKWTIQCQIHKFETKLQNWSKIARAFACFHLLGISEQSE